jgi:starch synthase (maltosyl-transferring)
MYRLAKGGFTQSYTYFTWRNLKWEIEQYFEELNHTPVCEFFWPNLWPNTPDILPEYLQTGRAPGLHRPTGAGGHALFQLRYLRAGLRAVPQRTPGPIQRRVSRFGEIPDSHWDLNAPHSLKDLIARVNRIRRENAALQQNRNLLFHAVDNEEIVCFSKHTDDFSNIMLVVVNLDPHHHTFGLLNLPVEANWASIGAGVSRSTI